MTEQELQELNRVIEEVRGQFPETKFPTMWTTDIWFGKKASNLTPFNGMKAVVGRYDDEPDLQWGYATVSPQYKLVRHEEAVHRTLEAVKKMPEYGKPKVKLTMITDRDIRSPGMEPVPGARMLMDIEFPDCKYEVKKGDLLNPRIRGFNSYNLKWEFGYQFWATQLICTNGLMAQKCLENVRKKHRLNLDIDELAAQLNEGMGQFSEQIGLWKRWAELEMPSDEFKNIFENLEITKKDEVKLLPHTVTHKNLEQMMGEKTVNLWDGYSIITQYLTHHSSSSQVELTQGEAVARAFEKASK